jgi:NADPH-dependent glutamate synthase beta subunit-like oxidoreductase
MDDITLSIDGVEVKANRGMTVLEAAQKVNIYIPTLCAHPDLSAFGACRLCAVDIEGVPGFPSACTTLASDGMIVHSNTPLVREVRRHFLTIILSRHPHICLTCEYRGQCQPQQECKKDIPVAERCCFLFRHCELQKVAEYIGISDDIPRYVPASLPVIKEEPLFDQDYNLCIHCGRCVRACQELRGVYAFGFITRDDMLEERPVGGSFLQSGCKFCGACVAVCPTGALSDRDISWDEPEATLVPCKSACPAGIDVPRYVDLITQGKFAQAIAVIREKVPFPATLGRVCFAPCEDGCKRGALNEPIAIRALKRFAAEQDTGLWRQSSRRAPATDERVAIVGSGPAGLTTGYYLAKLGHSVTVFEALPELGGMMRFGIPQYRLPRQILDTEIEDIKSVGVDIRTNSKVDSLDELFQQGYHAVFLAIGAHQGMKIGVEGEDSTGVIDCVSFLRDVSSGVEVGLGERVAVIGGGNAAIDSARTALRLGTREVTIIYRRSRAEMPAISSEVEEALNEGINIMFLAVPSKINQQNRALRLECLRMKLGRPDASGRRRPIPIKGSQFTMDVDTIIAAVGQTPQIPEQFRLATTRGNTLQAKPDTLATTRDGVFAGGDAVRGPASVIQAIADGRQAAISIDRYLGGKGIIDEKLVQVEEISPWLGRDGDFAYRHRVPIHTLSTDLRMGKFGRRHAAETGWLLAELLSDTFAGWATDEMPWQVPQYELSDFPEVELGWDEEQAMAEAKRCLKCHLRCKISPVILPPTK